VPEIRVPEHLHADWSQRLTLIEDTMRSISLETDPQSLVRTYGERMQQMLPMARRLSLSRRGLAAPVIRITRSTTWQESINPWENRDRLPVLNGGLLSDVCYANTTVLIDDLIPDPADPGFVYLDGCRSLLAIPNFEGGEALNTVVLLQYEPNGFDREQIPDMVWRSNLFGRATGTLVLKKQLEQALQAVDRELRTVARLQRALLPAELPRVPRLDLTAFYQPASRAGGDYYDFFELPEGQWGIFIGDVSGHGTPAAVMMAVTHCIAHTHPGPHTPPGRMLTYLNNQLAQRYTNRIETFATAFYGVYDPQTRRLDYASAGHNPPRLKRCSGKSVESLDKVSGLPLGVLEGSDYPEASVFLNVGDQLILYTDGISETHNAAGEQFGEARIDGVLAKCGLDSAELERKLIATVNEFAGNHPPHDDRTVIVMRAI
jgi:phosphoserine phosphatase RsbU/P